MELLQFSSILFRPCWFLDVFSFIFVLIIYGTLGNERGTWFDLCRLRGNCKQNRQEISPLDNFLSLFFYLLFYGMVQMSLGGIESKRNKYISRKNNPRFKHKSLIFWWFENKHRNTIMHRSHSLYVNTSNINFICITLTMMCR